MSDIIKQWLINNANDASLLGNSFMSVVGLVFAIGAPADSINQPAETKFKTLKMWWIIFWTSLVLMYPWYVFISDSKAIHPWAVFHGVATAAVTILWFYSSQKKQHKTALIIIFCSVFFLTMSSSYLDYWFDEKNPIISIIAYLFPWLAFLMLAWSYRRDMKTALVLLSYSILQIPTLDNQKNLELNFALLITTKILLIGAMYNTLGVKQKT